MFGYACDETPGADAGDAAVLATTSCSGWPRCATPANAPVLEPDAKSQVTLRYENGKPVEVAADRRLHPAQEAHRPAIATPKRIESVISPYVERVLPDGPDHQEDQVARQPDRPLRDRRPGRRRRPHRPQDHRRHLRRRGARTAAAPSPARTRPRSTARPPTPAATWPRTSSPRAWPSKCTIQISYAIGVAQPLSFYVDLHGTGEIDPAKLELVLPRADRRRHAARHPRAPAAQPPDLRPHRRLRPLRPPAGQRGRLLLGEDRPGRRAEGWPRSARRSRPVGDIRPAERAARVRRHPAL